jgi:hypothetical protein
MDKNSSVEKNIRKAYYDINSLAAYLAVDKIFEQAKKINKKVTRKKVKKYLQGEKTYAIYKPRPIRFKRLKTIPTGLCELQCDLAILDKLKN